MHTKDGEPCTTCLASRMKLRWQTGLSFLSLRDDVATACEITERLLTGDAKINTKGNGHGFRWLLASALAKNNVNHDNQTTFEQEYQPLRNKDSKRCFRQPNTAYCLTEQCFHFYLQRQELMTSTLLQCFNTGRHAAVSNEHRCHASRSGRTLPQGMDACTPETEARGKIWGYRQHRNREYFRCRNGLNL